VADEKSTEGARQGAGGRGIGAAEDQAEAAEDPQAEHLPLLVEV